MKRNYALALILLLVPFSTFAQYNDVAVIINDSSQTSQDIGNYFQLQRNIPNQNMIHITTTTAEEIDSTTFTDMRTQIENYLLANNLVDSINYIVTTKGVPLKIYQGPYSIFSSVASSSVDAELTLILGANSYHIFKNNSVQNPYFYGTPQPFSRDSFDMYLVTRLDGYTKNDVFDLIDRSGPNLSVNTAIAKSIFDISDTSYSLSTAIFQIYRPGALLLNNSNIDTVIDISTNMLSNQLDVFTYCGFKTNTQNLIVNNTWLDGSVAFLDNEYSAKTFSSAQNTNNEILVPNLIAEGATSVHGFAYNIETLTAQPKKEVFFERYLQNYNLAESYYMALGSLGWSDIIIGDPKTSIAITSPLKLAENVAQQETVELYPNPSTGIINIKSSDKILAIQIYSMGGKEVFYKEMNAKKGLSQIEVENYAPGIYSVIINTDKESIYKKVRLTR